MAVLTAAFACAPAQGTTVGGSTQSTNGPFVLAGSRIFLPTYSVDDPGMASGGPPGTGITNTASVLNFGTASHDWSSRDLTENGAGTPVLAHSGPTVAVAWPGPLQSALLSNGHLVAPASHTVTGSLGGLGVAVAADRSRATGWSDDNGVHLQSVSAAGAAGADVLLAPDASTDRVTVSPAPAGGWWVVWTTSSRLRARYVAADGSLSALRELAPASHVVLTHAPFLDPTFDYAWRAVVDAQGGLWVGLPHVLLHVTPTRVSTAGASTRPIVLAAGGSRMALVFRKGRHEIRVRVFAGATKRTVGLTGLGSPIDATVDRVTGKIYLLSSDAKESVRLTEIRAGGKHRSVALPFCHRRTEGEVEASGGLIAVACGGRYVQRDNVETGGDFQDGRNNLYVLMRFGKVLRRQTVFEGSYSY